MEKQMSDNNVTPIHIVQKTNTIFSFVREEGYRYEIPLYQRAFAWTEKEIRQLIEDIFDFSGGNYFIGSLIVAKKDSYYEVIDGQQRLTALFIIMNCVNFLNKNFFNINQQLNIPNTLTFSCREKSNYTLESIKEVIDSNTTSINEKKVSEEISSGIINVKKILTTKNMIKNFDYNQFVKNLEKVVLFRIEVPKNTDLNHYFEIMNTRGEQLEQADILKSILMDYLPESSGENHDREIFATIWDAISDMNGYIQMHFNYYQENKKERRLSNREQIFGKSWDETPEVDWDKYLHLDLDHSLNDKNLTVEQIIDNKDFVPLEQIEIEEERVRFESIIDFPHFLMHVLRVFINQYDIELENKNIIGKQLDDKNLLDEYKELFRNGHIKSCTVEPDKEKESMVKTFILFMLKIRYFYDKYIIKREFVLNNKNEIQNEDGEWSLQKLIYYITKKGYKNVNFEDTFKTKDSLMIQAAMRVSYTSPKVMHWITSTLIYLSSESFDENQLCKYCEDYVKKSVTINFLEHYSTSNPPGLDTPHIVFNYLDYLLWKENPTLYSDSFDFEFRTSVEHFYPQHPSEDSFPKWFEVNEKNTKDTNSESFNIFGNLCLLQRNINAKFSNLSPTSKIGSYESTIDKGSLKLRLMRESINSFKRTNNASDSITNKEWARYKGLAYVHEERMLNKLKSACKEIFSTNEVIEEE